MTSYPWQHCVTLITILSGVTGCGTKSSEVAPAAMPSPATSTLETGANLDTGLNQLVSAVKSAFAERDVDAYEKLVLGRPGNVEDTQMHREMFLSDSQRPLTAVQFEALGEDDTLEYELAGIRYRPAAEPRGWLRMTLDTGEGEQSSESTRVLVGVVDGVWRILAAVPAVE